MEDKTIGINVPSKTKVFLVEDERLVVEDIRERLTKNGYTVVGIASTGKEAIEAVRSMAPDILIMDVRISGELNGIETAIVIQSFFDHPIPVVFLTGFSETTFTYLKVLSEYTYLNKPFHESVLIEAIERALNKSKPGRVKEGVRLGSESGATY